jgi:hypothetical protein
VFLPADSGVERGYVIVFHDLNTLLQKDWATVQVIGYQVDRAAGDFDPMFERLGDGVHRAAERGQQRRMHVQNPAIERGDELGHQDLVEAGQDHQADVARPKRLAEDCLAVRSAGERGAVGEADRDARGFGAADGDGVGAIAADQHDPGRKARLTRGIEQGLQVRPGA